MKFLDIKYSTGKMIDNIIYCSAENYNGLYALNVETGESNFISFFPDENIETDSLYRQSVVFDRKVFFIPDNARNIVIFDVDKKIMETISHPVDKSYLKSNALLIDRCIWLLPINANHPISVLDLENRTFQMYDSINKMLNSDNQNVVLRCIVRNKTIWGIIYNTDCFFSFNTESKEFKIFHIQNKSLLGLNSFKRDHFWVTNYLGDEIYIVDDNGRYSLFTKREIQNRRGELSRSSGIVIEWNDKLYSFPTRDYTEIYEISIKTKETKSLDLPKDVYWENENRFFEFVDCEECFWGLPYGMRYGVKIDNRGVEFVYCKPFTGNIDDTPMKEYASHRKSRLYHESNEMRLERFIEKIMEDI